LKRIDEPQRAVSRLTHFCLLTAIKKTQSLPEITPGLLGGYDARTMVDCRPPRR
jgi:hypothetical protein